MKKLLFIGGTAFFGKGVVRKLIASKQYDITLLTRGNVIPEEFKGEVNFVQYDRTNASDLKRVLGNNSFDIVVDQVAYTGGDVESILDIIRGRIEHYLLCSTAAVYPIWHTEHKWQENEAVIDIIPGQHPYANGKREAEKKLLEYTDVPYTIYRPTIVQGPEDATQRTRYFVEKIFKQEPFYVPDNVLIQHTYSGDVSKAIFELINLEPTNKAYNISNDDMITLDEYCQRIAKYLGKESCHQVIPREQFLSIQNQDFPALYDHSLLLSNDLLKNTIEFQPTSIDIWLPLVVEWDKKHYC